MADSQSSFNEIFVLLGIGLAVILLRCYARWEAVGFSGWEADDYLMIVAMVSICARVIAYRTVGLPYLTGSICYRIQPRI